MNQHLQVDRLVGQIRGRPILPVRRNHFFRRLPGLPSSDRPCGSEVHLSVVTGPFLDVGHDQQRPIAFQFEALQFDRAKRSGTIGIENFSVAGGIVTSVLAAPTTGIRLTAASNSR